MKQVLFVDDDRIFLDSLSRHLKHMQDEWEMVFLTNPTRALQLLEKGPDTVVVLDWMMPDMDGLDFGKKLKERAQTASSPFLYIILLTAKGNTQDAVVALDSGVVDDYLSKPFNEQELRARIQIGHRLLTSERKLVENTVKALSESEKRFKAIFDNANDGIVLFEKESRTFDACNKKALQMLRYTIEEMKTLEITDIHPEDSLPFVLKQFEPKTRKQETLAKNIPLKRKDGYILYADISSFDITLHGKHFWVGIIRDITKSREAAKKLKHSEERYRLLSDTLKQANDEAREMALKTDSANKSKSMFLANMSHEIRTPMNGVIGMTGLLLEEDLTQIQREYVDIIHDSSAALLSVINDILDFSKIEAGKLNLEIVDFDLRTMIQDITNLMVKKASEQNISVTCLVHQEVPALLCGDPGRLRQIVTNLVGNAIKFTEQGEVRVRVDLEGESHTHANVRFSIQDTGIGIAKDKLNLVFESFSQVDASSTRRHDGSGLGLAICKQLAELMGSQIHVKSKEGKGSEFFFSLILQKQSRKTNRKIAPLPEIHKPSFPKESELDQHFSKMES